MRERRCCTVRPLPRATDGRLILAVDVSPWLRPDAASCPDRSFCPTYGRGKDDRRMVPGWPYSVIAALAAGRSSWTAPPDALRLEPGTDAAAVTAAQVRELAQSLISAGQWREGDLPILLILLIFDAGYDLAHLTYLTADIPVHRPGPGRPPGSKNRRRTERHDVGHFLAAGEAYKPSTHHKKGTNSRRTGSTTS